MVHSVALGKHKLYSGAKMCALDTLVCIEDIFLKAINLIIFLNVFTAMKDGAKA